MKRTVQNGIAQELPRRPNRLSPKPGVGARVFLAVLGAVVLLSVPPGAHGQAANLSTDEILAQYDPYNRSYEGVGYWNNAGSSHPGEPVALVLAFQESGGIVTLNAQITWYVDGSPAGSYSGTGEGVATDSGRVFDIGEDWVVSVHANLGTANDYVTPLITLWGSFSKPADDSELEDSNALFGTGGFEIEKEVPLNLQGSEGSGIPDFAVVGLVAAGGLGALLLLRRRRKRKKKHSTDATDDQEKSQQADDEVDAHSDDRQGRRSMALEADIEPGDIRIDEGEPATLFARVHCTPHDAVREKAALADLDVTVEDGFDEWTVLSSAPADEWDEYRRFYVSFRYDTGSRFDGPDAARLEFPVTVPLSIQLRGHPETKQTLGLEVDAADSALVTYPESMVLLPGKTDEVRLMIRNPGADTWELSYHVAGAAQEEISIERGPGSAHSCIFEVAAADLELRPGETRRHDVVFTARSSGRELSRAMSVTVINEGLIVLSPAPITVKADVESSSQLLVTALYVADGQLQTDYDTLLNLGFEINGDSMLTERAFENAKLVFERGDMMDAAEVEAARGLPRGVRVLPFTIHSKRVLPGRLDDRYTADLHYFADCPRTGELYHDSLPLEMICFVDYPDDLDKQVEYEHVLDVIGKGFIPPELKDRFLRIVYDQGDLLGPEGLRTLRKRIISTAIRHWQAVAAREEHKAMIYRDYEQILNWTEWAGSIAFNVLMGIFFGPLAATLRSVGKDLIVSALKAYSAGKSADQWLDDQWQYLKWQAPDQVITMLAIKKKLSSPSVYILCTVWMFYRNLRTNEYDIEEAAWRSAKDVGTMALTMFLTGIAVRSAKKHGYTVDEALQEEYERQRRKGTSADPEDATAVSASEDGSVNDVKSEDYRIASELAEELKAAGTEADANAKRKVSDLVEAVRNGDQARVTEAGLRVFEDQNAILEMNNQAGLATERGLINDMMDGFRTRALEKTKHAISEQHGAPLSEVSIVTGTNKRGAGDVANKTPADLDYMVKIGDQEVSRFQAAEVFDRFFYEELNADPVARKLLDGKTPQEVNQIFDNHAMGWDDPEFYWDIKSLKNPEKAYSHGLNYSDKHAENMAWAIDYKNNHHFSEGARLRRLGHKSGDRTCFLNSERAMKQGIRTFNKQIKKQVRPKMDALQAAYRKVKEVSPNEPLEKIQMDPDLAKGLEIMQSGKTPIEIEMELRRLNHPSCRTFDGLSKMAGNYLQRLNHELFHTRKNVARKLREQRIRKQKAEINR